MTTKRPAAWRLAPARMPGVVIVAGLFVAALAAPAIAAPPAGGTYFTVPLGLDARYSWQADCLRFSRSRACTSDGDCGRWIRTEPLPDGAFSFEIELELEDGGVPVRIAGEARIETRGKRDAIGGAAHAAVDGQTFNFALTGRSTSRRRCARLLELWGANQP